MSVPPDALNQSVIFRKDGFGNAPMTVVNMVSYSTFLDCDPLTLETPSFEICKLDNCLS